MDEQSRHFSVPEIEEVILQKEEDLKPWCRSSGENAGRMTPATGDDWWIECPTCGMRWCGGSTVLPDHDVPFWRPPGRASDETTGR